MVFQTQVFATPAFGIPGEVYDSSPVVSEPYILNSTNPLLNVYGNVFTIVDRTTAPNQVTAGNTTSVNGVIFAGFLVNPKAGVSFGTSGGGPLAPTLIAPNGIVGELLTQGSLIISLTNASASVGDVVIYNNLTGAVSTIAPSTAVPAGFTFAFAYIARFVASAVSGVTLAVANVNYYQAP